ncbi:unnamed protein product, partial [Prorocentrum cordatum]
PFWLKSVRDPACSLGRGMAIRDGAECAPRRTAQDRKAARLWAIRSADRAVSKLSEELGRIREQHTQLLDFVGALAGGDAELADRLLALAPALQDLLRGRLPSHVSVLRRNVALHSDASGVSIASAGVHALKSLQKGPRLECRQEGFVWNPEAPVFVPQGSDFFEQFMPAFEGEQAEILLRELGHLTAQASRAEAVPEAESAGGPPACEEQHAHQAADVSVDYHAEQAVYEPDADEHRHRLQQYRSDYPAPADAFSEGSAVDPTSRHVAPESIRPERDDDCVNASDVLRPGGTAGRAPLPPAPAADGGATAGVPGASCDGSDVDDVTLDGEADADTSCSVGEPPGADHAGTAAAAAAYLAAFPQALFSGVDGGWGRCEVVAGDWWRARAFVARVWLTTGAATVQESGAAGSAAPPPPLPDVLLRAECPMSGRAAGAVAPPQRRRVRFADAPCVLDIGRCSGVRGILRRESVPGFLDPAWTRHAKAVDLMHMIEGGSFGLKVPPMRRPHQLRVRFADGSRLVDALPPGMSVERYRELRRLITLCGGQ